MKWLLACPTTLLVCAIVVGCSAETTSLPAPGPDAAIEPDGDGNPEPPPPTDPTPAPDNATLIGVVTRSTHPRAGGVGDLFIGVFEDDPVLSSDDATAVATLKIDDADMSADDAAIPYSIPGIRPRGEPYFVSAFLDDNGNSSADQAPDRGDLVTLDGLGSPEVTVDVAGEVEYEIVLNAAMPF